MQNELPARLLWLLAGGGIRSLAELARRLDVSEELVRLVTEDLTRRGYLAALNTGCATACAGCAHAAACGGPAAAPPVLALTARGRQVIAGGAK